MNEDFTILEYLNQSKLRGVRYLVCKYGYGMSIVANRTTGDMEKAQKLVYDVFFKLWTERKFDNVQPPLRLFLYQEVKKACRII